MAFAYPLPWWLLTAIVTAAAAVAWFAYRHVTSGRARTILIAIRFVTLALLIVALMRPVARISEVDTRGAVVAVLVDGSRSMGIADAAGNRDGLDPMRVEAEGLQRIVDHADRDVVRARERRRGEDVRDDVRGREPVRLELVERRDLERGGLPLLEDAAFPLGEENL